MCEPNNSMSTDSISSLDRKSYEKVGRIYNEVVRHNLFNQDSAVLKSLLQTEGDINYRIFKGSRRVPNLLHAASNHPELLALLLDYGADYTRKDDENRTVLHKAVRDALDRSSNDHRLWLGQDFEEIIDLVLAAHVKFNDPSNPRDDDGISHFHAACMTNNKSAVKFFLENGVDADQAVNADSLFFSSDTPLHLAVKFKNHNVLVMLLNHGANVRLKNADGLSNLQLLGERTTSRYHGNYYGNSHKPLSFLTNYSSYAHFSCSKNGHKAMKLWIKKNADLLMKNEKGDSPLRHLLSNVDLCEEYCAMFIKTTVVQARLEEEFGITKLHLACHLANDKLVKNLIKNGASVNAKVRGDSPIWQGRTPLHLTVHRAVEKCQDKNTITALKKVVELLMKHGADPILVDSNNDTSFHMIKDSVYRNSLVQMTPLISILFEHLSHFNDNPKNYQGLSLFHIACLTVNVTAIEKFLEQSVDVNQAIGHFSRDCPGSTPLHLVIKSLNNQAFNRGYTTATLTKLIDLLLINGANINATDAFGDTPLHDILKPGLGISRGPFIENLISKGADTNALNVKGESPVAICLKVDNPDWESIDVFLKHGCDVNIYNAVTQYGYIHAWDIKNIIRRQRILDINCAGRTVLHNMVCRKPYLYVDGYIEPITTYGCDIDHQDNEGKTALHLAVLFGNNEAVMELLENGADINITDSQGKTALAYCNEVLQTDDRRSYESRPGYDDDSTPKSMTELFAFHAHKLEFSGQWVSEENEDLLLELEDGGIDEKDINLFHGEIAEAKNIKIGTTTLSVYEFLMDDDVDAMYANMTEEEREEVDEFIEVISDPQLRGTKGLMKSKYRYSIGRTKLFDPALSSFNRLTKYQLPELCSRYILKFLMNGDLKRLISAAT